jgi:UDP-N-acetylmuramoyl-L-alanyl-D-glutamate--2,6-diaminopimelate ligase
MAAIAERHCDRVVITSDNPRFEDPDTILDDVQRGFSAAARYERIADRATAIAATVAMADASTVIVIAGKGHETYQDIQGVRHPLDDRELAAAAIHRRTP